MVRTVGLVQMCMYLPWRIREPEQGGPEIPKDVVHLSGHVGPRAKSWEKGEKVAKGRQQKSKRTADEDGRCPSIMSLIIKMPLAM